MIRMNNKIQKSVFSQYFKTIKHGTILILLFLNYGGFCQSRWELQNDGSTRWNIKTDIPHYDHIEMSGETVSTVLRYGVNKDGSFSLERSLIWPMLRTIPNNTHASLMQRYAIDFASLLTVNGQTLKTEKVKNISLNGIFTVVSEYSVPSKIELTRQIFNSTTKPMLCERYTVKNNSEKPVNVIVPEQKTIYHTDSAKGVEGSYTIETGIQKSGFYNLKPGQQIQFDTYFQAWSHKQTASEVDRKSVV